MSAEPYLRVVWTDPVTGRNGYLVIDRLVRGIAGGGTRVRRGVTLQEVERLARTMTLKNGSLNVPSGGAKAGLDTSIDEPGGHEMLVRFLTAVKPILESRWATAEDLGITQEELDAAFREIGLPLSVYAGLKVGGDFDGSLKRVKEGLSVSSEGIGLADLIGGFGVAEAAFAALAKAGLPVAGSRAVVQGFGSMGGGTARYLARKGVKVVGVVDVKGCVVNPDGLDVESLLAHRSPAGDVDRSQLPAGATERPREEWLDIEAEVLVPAALADVLTEENADRVRAKVVVEAANNPTRAEADEILLKRNVVVVPDILANAGGVTVSYFEWVQNRQHFNWDLARVRKELDRVMVDSFERVWNIARDKHVSLRTAAYIIGIGRVGRATVLGGI